jgi:hypothetical protein
MSQCHTAMQRLQPKYASYGIRSCITERYTLSSPGGALLWKSTILSLPPPTWTRTLETVSAEAVLEV